MNDHIPGLDPVARDWLLSAGTASRYRPRLTPEQTKALKKQQHDEDPKHTKALARRKKRGRGGPK